MGLSQSILKEEDRSKLDGIVMQMQRNNESEDDIQFVVDDFKSKYGLKKKDGGINIQSNSTSQLQSNERFDPNSKHPLSNQDINNISSFLNSSSVKRGAIVKDQTTEEKLKGVQSKVDKLSDSGKILTQTHKLSENEIYNEAAKRLTNVDNKSLMNSSDPYGNFDNAIQQSKKNLIDENSLGEASVHTQNEQQIHDKMSELLHDNAFSSTQDASNYLYDQYSKSTGNTKPINNISIDELKSKLPDNLSTQLAIKKISNSRFINSLMDESKDFNDFVGKYKNASNKFLHLNKNDENENAKAWQQIMDDPDVIEAAKQNPDKWKDYLTEKGQFNNRFPELAKQSIASKISQYREDNGLNNKIYNNPSKNDWDDSVEKMFKDGKIDAGDRVFYYNNINPSDLKTTGLVESLGRGYEEGVRDIGKTLGLEQAGLLADQSHNTQVDPTNNRILGGGGHLLGNIVPLLLTGSALKGIGFSEKASNGLSAMLQFGGNNAEQAKKHYPDDPLSQFAYTAIGTSVDALLMELPGDAKKGVRELLGKEAKEVIPKLTDNSISDAVKEQVKESFLQKATSTLGKYGVDILKHNVKTAGILTGIDLLHKGLNLASGDESAFDNTDVVNEFMNNFKSATGLSAASSLGKLAPKEKSELGTAINELPEGIYTNALKEALKSGSEETVSTYLKNIAEQLNSSESDASTTRKVFGDKVTDIALKLYPYAKMSEIKNDVNSAVESEQSKISVIKPEENASPNIVELKKSENEIAENNEQTKEESTPITETDKNIGSAEEVKQKSEQTSNEGDGIESPKESVDDINKIGITHELRTERAEKLEESEPERGEGISVKESIQKGKRLLEEGADPSKVAKDFKVSGKISEDDIAIVRAEYNRLAKNTNDAAKEFGVNSKEDKAAKATESKWYNESVKPMQTAWSNIGKAQQGQTDIDTGSFAGMRRAFEQQNSGKEMSQKQQDEAKQLSLKVEKLTKERDDIQRKLTEALNNGVTENEKSNTKKYTEKAKKVADKFRKLKQQPFNFKDENGNDVEVSKMGIGWNDLVEFGAKAIEKTGKLADGVSAIIEKIKDTDFYVKLSDNGRKELEQKLADHYEKSLKDTPEAKNIRRLEKELEDLRSGNVKNNSPKRDLSDQEKELQDKIFEEKQKLGLIKSKSDKPDDQQLADQDNIEKLATKFEGKKDSKFSAQDSKDIWDYAKKEYIDNDIDFDTMITNVGMDLGLSREQVRDALVTPKNIKPISDAMYRKQYERNRAIQHAKDWVKATGVNPIVKWLGAIPRAFFALKVFGHGTVGFITHAGVNIFDPVEWKRYWPLYFKQFKMVYGDKAKYEQIISDHINDPQYTFWKRNGLAVDPNERYDDYQFITRMFDKWKIGRWLTGGDRGFNALKLYRLERAKGLYKNLSAVEKADPNTGKMIATLVNHSTGTSHIPLPEAANVMFFAPRLEASRWNRLIVDPANAAKTFLSWNKAAPSDRAAAKIVAKRAGRILATYVGSLMTNQAILSLSGANQKINFTDPTQSDFLKFKMGGRTLDLTGGMISIFDFLANMVHASTMNTSDLPKGKTRKDMLMQYGWNYVTGKLSPFASTVKDVATQHDFQGNSLPFSSDKPQSGKRKLSWNEYLTESQTPIPIAEAFNDAHKQMIADGMPKANADIILGAIITGVLVGGTGVKIGEEPNAKPTPFNADDNKDQTFKFFLDKGLELPNTALTSETIKDESTHTVKKISDYPKDVQDNYSKVHKQYLKDELENMRSKTLFVNEYGDVSTHKSKGSEGKDISELNKKQLTEVLHLAQSLATKKSKKEIFNND